MCAEPTVCNATIVTRSRSSTRPYQAGRRPGLRVRRTVRVRLRPGRDHRQGLEIGAADYIVKPFSPTELVARIHAALRKHDAPPETFLAGDLVINCEEHRVSLTARTLQLTATEYELLPSLQPTPAAYRPDPDRELGRSRNCVVASGSARG